MQKRIRKLESDNTLYKKINDKLEKEARKDKEENDNKIKSLGDRLIEALSSSKRSGDTL